MTLYGFNLLDINNDLSQKELNEMLKEFELDYLYSESN